MRRVLPIFFLLLIISASDFAFAVQDVAVQDVVTGLRARSILMTMLLDGKQVGRDLVVDVTIEYANSQYVVTWDAVRVTAIDLSNDVKRTHLRAEHFGTDTGTIKNIVVKEKFISFDIARSHGDMKVDIFKKGEFGLDIEIKAYGACHRNSKQKIFAEEWVMTDNIRLPSRDVLGYPEKKPKKR